MPYISVEELEAGMEEAYVIDKNEYDAVVAQRDELLERAVSAEDAYKRVQDKYAKAVLENKPVINEQNFSTYEPATFSNLFK